MPATATVLHVGNASVLPNQKRQSSIDVFTAFVKNNVMPSQATNSKNTITRHTRLNSQDKVFSTMAKCTTLLTVIFLCILYTGSAFIIPHSRYSTGAKTLKHDSETTLLFAADAPNDQQLNNKQQERTSGLLVLASVPLAWGTYIPVVKYMYEVEPKVPGLVFSAANYVVAAMLLNYLSLSESSRNGEEQAEVDTEDFPFQGGLELGLYLFIANVLQVKGLETVPSVRAGFLVQLTTIMVPILQSVMSGMKISGQTWLASIFAFTGVVLMGIEGSEGISSTAKDISINVGQGDLLIMCAAVLYSLHTIRLGGYATQASVIKLSASKATAQALLSVGLVSSLFLTSPDGEISTFANAMTSGLASSTVTLTTMTPVIIAVVWTGFIACAYTIYAQAYGQARVGPTEANLIYSIQPLFTAVFGYFLLGETLSPTGTILALLIGAAVFSVANGENDDDDSGDFGILDISAQEVKDTVLDSMKR